MSANNSILGGSGLGSFALAVADKEFTKGEAKNIEQTLVGLSREIQSLVRTLQSHTEDEKETTVNVTYMGL